MIGSVDLGHLVQEKLAGLRVDTVAFVDRLLDVAEEVGAIRCSLASNDKLRFQLANRPPSVVELDSALAKLRMICARLGVSCIEAGQDVSLYGGDGMIQKQSKRWSVRFSNTLAAHEFTIEAKR